ncbi:MAG: metal ABC transporter permease [Desulfovibrio sp.]|jgi:manganese/iron transport system permease protein|nr:metal ABC transporter permease [Desulfovibrio sp.]
MESFLSYEFLRRALLMGVLGGGVCGALGVFVVLWRMSLVGMCISHAAFAGALVGLWLGFPPLAGGLAAGLGAAALSGPLAERPGFSLDTAMGVIFSVVMSLAMLALGLLPGARTEGLSLIWGSLLTVTAFDLALMSGAACTLSLFIVCFFKEIQAIIGHSQAALACGVPVRQIRHACLALMGLVVACALKAIGGLLIFSLIVTPAAAALQITYSLRLMFVLSAAFGAVAAACGLWLSFHFALPAGAAIVLFSALILIACMIFSPKRNMPPQGG